MKSNVEHINSVQRKVTVTIPAEKVAAAFEGAYNKLRMKAKIAGFRPGKAPLNVIKKAYGASVSGEVGEKLINDHLFVAINENKIMPIASPVVETMKQPLMDADYEFTAIVDIMPVIEIKGYKDLSIESKKYEVGPDSLERELSLVARRQAKTKVLDNADSAEVAEGQLVMISHSAKVEGQEMPEMNANGVPVAIGRKEVFPELEAGMLKMKKNESKVISFTLPADFQDATLAGKHVDFTVTVEDIMALDVPKVDDELAKDINFESLDDLKNRINESLTQNAKDMETKDLEQNLLDALRKMNDFEVPPSMTDQVIDGMVAEMGIKDEAMKKKALADRELRRSMLPEAKKRAQNTILLWEVAKAEKIEISDEDAKSHIKEFLMSNQPENVSDKRIEDTFKSVGPRIKENMLLEKALDFLTTNAKVNYTSVKI